MTTATKPVVTQADDGLALFIARIHDLTPNGEWIRVKHHPNGDWSIDHGPLTDAAYSSQAVVSQDLVPVAWRYEHPEFGVQVFTGRYDRPSGGIPDDFLGWTETPLYPASAIEAAQIAARNEALDEAAKVAWDALHPHPNQPESDWTDFAKQRSIAAMMARSAIRSLRTPSQHQEEQ